jgi:hypothetical protein
LRQIDQFKRMGFGGFHIHSRTGLASEYLGDDFLNAVRACTEKAAREGMLSWLYDEDRWPSGSAGGIVTRESQYRIKHLWTATPYHDPRPPARMADYTAAARTENGRLLARYEIELLDGRLKRYRRLKDAEMPARNARIWYAYVETPFESPWFNFHTYADTLSRATIKRFIEVTHDRFATCVGEYFGNVCPAIFADEPQFIKKSQFNRADETRDLLMPWTDDFCRHLPSSVQAGSAQSSAGALLEPCRRQAIGRTLSLPRSHRRAVCARIWRHDRHMVPRAWDCPHRPHARGSFASVADARRG